MPNSREVYLPFVQKKDFYEIFEWNLHLMHGTNVSLSALFYFTYTWISYSELFKLQGACQFTLCTYRKRFRTSMAAYKKARNNNHHTYIKATTNMDGRKRAFFSKAEKDVASGNPKNIAQSSLTGQTIPLLFFRIIQPQLEMWRQMQLKLVISGFWSTIQSGTNCLIIL